MITPASFYILTFTNIVVFSLGFILGKIFTNSQSFMVNDMVSVKSKKEERNKTNIEIDDTKYVGKIKTDGLEKKYDSLGDVKKSKNDTISSVNKLKNLKR
jgi:hypothetical protein